MISWLACTSSGAIPKIIDEGKNGNLFQFPAVLRAILEEVAEKQPWGKCSAGFLRNRYRQLWILGAGSRGSK